jgi:hypothetical protein
MSQLLICDKPLLFEDLQLCLQPCRAGHCETVLDLTRLGGMANAGITFADRIKKLPKMYQKTCTMV